MEKTNKTIERAVDNGYRAMKMLQILRFQKGNIIKSSELKEKLGLSDTRVIRRYKTILIKLGYNVKSFSGYEGGYCLIEENLNDRDIENLEKNLSKDLFEKVIRIINKM